jgi:hypothetical protein
MQPNVPQTQTGEKKSMQLTAPKTVRLLHLVVICTCPNTEDMAAAQSWRPLNFEMYAFGILDRAFGRVFRSPYCSTTFPLNVDFLYDVARLIRNPVKPYAGLNL